MERAEICVTVVTRCTINPVGHVAHLIRVNARRISVRRYLERLSPEEVVVHNLRICNILLYIMLCSIEERFVVACH